MQWKGEALDISELKDLILDGEEIYVEIPIIDPDNITDDGLIKSEPSLYFPFQLVISETLKRDLLQGGTIVSVRVDENLSAYIDVSGKKD